MAITPEAQARLTIDVLLTAAGWIVQNYADLYLHAARGVAVREFPLATGHADYLLFVDGMVVGVIEAKRQGTTLSGYEVQASRYSVGLPLNLNAPRRPLPFLYVSTGIETRFTNLFDPAPRSRPVFGFHQPGTLADWLSEGETTLRRRLATPYPALPADSTLWRPQIEAIHNLEHSLAEARERALIQMATGSGKTFTAVHYVYRMLRHGKARRVLFLVDRGNLARQTLMEFQNFTTPDDGRKFTEIYNVQHLTSNQPDDVSKVIITTIQRVYSMLRGEPDLDPALEEEGLSDPDSDARPREVSYNPRIPPEYFDILITDECHRSIYNVWRQVLEYFDAFLIGMTATPGQQTFGFFQENLVMEYDRAAAVLDGINVPGEVYQIRTRISGEGSTIEAGYMVPKRDRRTRAVRMEQLDRDLTYTANQLDTQVMSESQIRTIIRTFRDRLPEIMPGRTEVPKTLVFAKDDSHAEDIVRIIREEFAQGNDFCQKITYRVDGNPEDRINAFRNSYNPRIAVTVDMIATGTDVKAIEILLFMRLVKSAGLYEQMQGRGVRVIQPADLQAVTPDATRKERFVLVDAVGVIDQPMTETVTLERRKSVAFGKLLDDLAAGDTSDDTLLTLAGRLARLDHRLTERDAAAVQAASGGLTLPEIARQLRAATDPDAHYDAAKSAAGAEPDEAQIAQAEAAMKDGLLRLMTPALRHTLKDVQARDEMVIDDVSRDAVTFAGFVDDAGARAVVETFSDYIERHRDEITALRILYSIPQRAGRLQWQNLTELAERLKEPPLNLTPEKLWSAYARLEPERVRQADAHRSLTDLIALVRHAAGQQDELVPFSEQVAARYVEWLDAQTAAGVSFTPEQRDWLDRIAAHIGVNVTMTLQDFQDGEFFQRGGVLAAQHSFGDGPALRRWVDALNDALAA